MKCTKVRLGAICQEIYRYPTYYDIGYIDEGVPEIRGELITSDGSINLNREKWRFISEKTSSKFSRTVLLEDDLVMSVRGTIGKIGLIPKELVGANITANLIRISPNRLKVNERYLWSYMRSTEFINSLNSASSSTTIKTIKAPDLKDILIPLPSLAEQKRIAEILDRTQSLISKRKEAITLLNTLTQSIFLEMFGDPLINSKGWSRFQLCEVCDNITDGTHDTPDRVSFGIPFITSKNIRPFKIDLSVLEFVTPETHTEIIKRCNPRPKDVLYTNIGVNIGNAVANRLTFEFSLKNVALIQPNSNKLDSFFLEMLLNYEPFKQSILKVSSTGGAQKFIALKVLRSVQVIIPPMSLQQEFSQRVEALEKLKATHRASLSQLQALFASLQHRAFRGEL